VKPPVLVIVIA
jgi:hypothetical protein